MAYVSKEMKAKLVNEVKAVLPKDWKVTFAVRNYSTLICTVRKAPVDLNAAFGKEGKDLKHYSVNEYYVERNCTDSSLVETINKIISAMNKLNYDNSDPMTDYFDVGYYTELRFGEYDKPFESTK